MIPLITLLTDHYEISPTVANDREELFAVASDPALWEQHNASDRYQRPVFDQLFQDGVDSGGALTIRKRVDGRVVGSFRYKILAEDSIEIGWTYLERSIWGTGANGEIKVAMMKHAYQYVPKLYWMVYEGNFRSQGAVRKLGAHRLPDDHVFSKPATFVYEAGADSI